MMSRIRKWLLILRAYAFPVAALPGLQAAILAARSDMPADWQYLPLLLLALLALHGGTNVINDYYDFRTGLDQPGAAPSTWALAEQLLRPRQALRLGVILLLAAPVVALPALIARGAWLWGFGAIGLAGGFFYTAPPLKLKYRASGELLVFALTGPWLTAAVFYGLTARLTASAWWCGMPAGFMAAALLYANNLRDCRRDADAGCRTMAQHLGRAAPFGYAFLVASAFLALAPLYGVGGIDMPGVFFPLAALPFLWRPARMSFAEKIPADIDIHAARGLMVFGLLLAAGLAAPR